MHLNEILLWRYATKKMNGQIVPQEKVDYVLEAARLAPSSSGLQPYKVFVIKDKALLEKIKPIAFNQNQITECSLLLVWAAWNSYSKEKIKTVFASTVKERGMPENAMDAYLERLWDNYKTLGEDWHYNHAAKQAYISLAMAMVAAAEKKIDTTPMEGFDPDKLDELLGLNKLGLKSVVILPLGYRDTETDWLAKLKKVRTPKNEFITEIK